MILTGKILLKQYSVRCLAQGKNWWQFMLQASNQDRVTTIPHHWQYTKLSSWSRMPAVREVSPTELQRSLWARRSCFELFSYNTQTNQLEPALPLWAAQLTPNSMSSSDLLRAAFPENRTDLLVAYFIRQTNSRGMLKECHVNNIDYVVS